MRLWCVLAAVLALSATGVARAQEPEPVGTLTLSESSPGVYQLEFKAVRDRSPYVVAIHSSRIGTDHGLTAQLAEQDEPEFVLDLPGAFDGMTQEGCYRVSLSVVADSDDLQAADFSQSASIETRGCVDASGNTTFPSHDNVTVPPPAPPTDVRVAPHASGGWVVEWRDNSADEIAFDVGIIFMDQPWAEGGSAVSGLELPLVEANQTVIGAIGTGQFFFPTEPAEATCGYAMVLVFAIGPDSPSIWPGNTTVPACFGAGTLSFPDTGHGSARDENDLIERAALALTAGILLVLAGARLRGLADRLTS